jgi:3-dehydroquinate synthase
MKQITIRYPSGATQLYLAAGMPQLKKITDQRSTVLVTDEHIYKAHEKRFKGWNTIILKAGEEFKTQGTVDNLVATLIEMEADRSTTLVGVGGGMITDITGYAASVYMRGIRFGFLPTSILGLVDASIGGKNGVDVGAFKNMVGTIRQPAFILHDMSFLVSLPKKEWKNGFAEIIKHACIKDPRMFSELEKGSLEKYMSGQEAIGALIEKNALLKSKVVRADETEKGERRLLNFGHTLGHALEMQYELMHGQAVAIGMTAACHISEKLTGFRETERVVELLERYGLPTYAGFNKQKVVAILKMDKKRVKKEMNYVLLEKVGKAAVRSIPLKQLEKFIQEL